MSEIMFVITLFSCITLSLNEANSNIEVSAGASWKPLPDAIVYEATIPLNYETRWIEDRKDYTTPLKYRYEDNRKDSSICLMISQMNALSKAFFKEFELLKDNWSTGSMKYKREQRLRAERSLDFIGSGLSWCCGVATMEKLKLIDEKEGNVEQRLNRMNQGLSSTIKQIVEDSQHFKDYENTVAETLNDTELRMKFIEKHTADMEYKISNSAVEQETITLNVLNNQYLGLKSILLTRALRRQSILNSCKHHRIPADIIHPKVLRKDLEKLEEVIKTSGQGLAIPVSEISKYFQIQVCDCSFTNTKLFIHIKIPTVQENLNWQLYELITTPFAWFKQTCLIPHQPLFMAVSITQDNRDDIRQTSGSGLHQCKPYHDQLCYIPRFSADSIQGPQCAKKLYEGTTVQELSQYCPMNCHSATSMIISEIYEEIYIVTHPQED